MRLAGRLARATFEPDLSPEDQDAPEMDRERFAKALKRYLNRRELDVDDETALTAPIEPLVTSLTMGLPFEPSEKQALLEAETLAERLSALRPDWWVRRCRLGGPWG